MHGTEDMAVAYNQSVILHSALKRADVPSALLTVTGGGHGVGVGVLNEYVQKFIDGHLGNKRAVFKDHLTGVEDRPALGPGYKGAIAPFFCRETGYSLDGFHGVAVY